QGIPWLLRKPLLYTSLTLAITNTTTPEGTVNYTARQTSIKAAPGPPDTRRFNWEVYEQENLLFGTIVCRTRYIEGESVGQTEGEMMVRPAVEVQSVLKDERDKILVRRFLRGEVEDDGQTVGRGFLVEGPSVGSWLEGEGGETCQGAGGCGIWVHLFDRKKDAAGWSSEQVWGFEMIDGERLHTRRVVATDSRGVYRLARLVHRLVDG
ncbi:uncharacterized protein BP01DRAFT_406738, partial [Aspergillus saccharolyticus JOP 1030-1]